MTILDHESFGRLISRIKTLIARRHPHGTPEVCALNSEELFPFGNRTLLTLSKFSGSSCAPLQVSRSAGAVSQRALKTLALTPWI